MDRTFSHRRRLLLLAALFAAFGLCDAMPAQAQAQTTGVALYRYAEPGQPVIQLQVWGHVGMPGVYQVQPDTDLLRLVSFAGGPRYTGGRPEERPRMTVHVFRSEGGTRAAFFSADLDALADGRQALPELREGDIVRVESIVTRRFDWRDGLAVLTSVGTLAVVVLQIIAFS